MNTYTAFNARTAAAVGGTYETSEDVPSAVRLQRTMIAPQEVWFELSSGSVEPALITGNAAELAQRISDAVKAAHHPAALLISARAPQAFKAAARAEAAKHGLELIEE